MILIKNVLWRRRKFFCEYCRLVLMMSLRTNWFGGNVDYILAYAVRFHSEIGSACN